MTVPGRHVAALEHLTHGGVGSVRPSRERQTTAIPIKFAQAAGADEMIGIAAAMGDAQCREIQLPDLASRRGIETREHARVGDRMERTARHLGAGPQDDLAFGPIGHRSDRRAAILGRQVESAGPRVDSGQKMHHRGAGAAGLPERVPCTLQGRERTSLRPGTGVIAGRSKPILSPLRPAEPKTEEQ